MAPRRGESERRRQLLGRLDGGRWLVALDRRIDPAQGVAVDVRAIDARSRRRRIVVRMVPAAVGRGQLAGACNPRETNREGEH